MNNRYKTMTNPYNDNRYRKKAVRSEKLSREDPFNDNKSHYSEEAGDYWLKQAKTSSGIDPIDTKNCLYHALHAYGRAEKLSKKEDNNERIGKKKASVESKVESLIKKRSEVKTSNKRITFENKLEKITSSKLLLPILSAAAFLFSFLFSSFSITGLVIKNNVMPLFSYISLTCFSVGIILTIVSLKSFMKRRKKC